MLTLWEIRKSVLNRSVALRCRRRRRPSVVCSSAFTHRKHPAAAGKLFACLSTSGWKKVRKKKFWKAKKSELLLLRLHCCNSLIHSMLLVGYEVGKIVSSARVGLLADCRVFVGRCHPASGATHRKQGHTSFVRRQRVKLAFSHQPTTTESRHQRVGTKGDKWPRNGY